MAESRKLEIRNWRLPETKYFVWTNLAGHFSIFNFPDTNEFQGCREPRGFLRFTPKALDNIAQGRGASPRTLGID